MAHTRRARAFLICLGLVYLTWSALAMNMMAQQVTGHNHHGSHAAQHSTAACQLLCTATAFIHTTDQPLQQAARLALSNPPAANDDVVHSLSIYTLYARPPPILLT